MFNFIKHKYRKDCLCNRCYRERKLALWALTKIWERESSRVFVEDDPEIEKFKKIIENVANS